MAHPNKLVTVSNLFYEIESLEHDVALATEFGHLMVAWSKAEDMIACVSSDIIGIETNLALELMTRIPSFESRTKWLQVLLDHWKKNEPKKAKNLKVIIEALSNLASQRNGWVHGKWCKHQRSNRTMIFDLRKPAGKARGKIITAMALKNHRLAVRKLTDQLITEIPGYLLLSDDPIPRDG